MKIVAERGRHPVAIYCTAGKDRTGLIIAIILLAVGVPKYDIIADYTLSDKVYMNMDSSNTMIAALNENKLDVGKCKFMSVLLCTIQFFMYYHKLQYHLIFVSFKSTAGNNGRNY